MEFDMDEDDFAVTAVFEEEEDALPASAILGSYPNPFNTWTKISLFVHERDARAIKLLKIYNLLGQLVAVVDVSHLPAGMHDMPLEVGGILERKSGQRTVHCALASAKYHHQRGPN